MPTRKVERRMGAGLQDGGAVVVTPTGTVVRFEFLFVTF